MATEIKREKSLESHGTRSISSPVRKCGALLPGYPIVLIWIRVI